MTSQFMHTSHAQQREIRKQFFAGVWLDKAAVFSNNNGVQQ